MFSRDSANDPKHGEAGNPLLQLVTEGADNSTHSTACAHFTTSFVLVTLKQTHDWIRACAGRNLTHPINVKKTACEQENHLPAGLKAAGRCMLLVANKQQEIFTEGKKCYQTQQIDA